MLIPDELIRNISITKQLDFFSFQGWGSLPDLCKEGLCLQQLVWECWGGPDGSCALQLPGGNQSPERSSRRFPFLPKFSPSWFQPAGRAGSPDQELPCGLQPLHLVHYGGSWRNLEESAENYQGKSVRERVSSYFMTFQSSLKLFSEIMGTRVCHHNTVKISQNLWAKKSCC